MKKQILGKKEIVKYSYIFFDSYYNYIITALSLVVGLTWKDTLIYSFKNNKLLRKLGPWGYTIVLTIVVIVLIQIINIIHNLQQKSNSNDNSNDNKFNFIN